jgi:hypothetical protein
VNSLKEEYAAWRHSVGRVSESPERKRAPRDPSLQARDEAAAKIEQEIQADEKRTRRRLAKHQVSGEWVPDKKWPELYLRARLRCSCGAECVGNTWEEAGMYMDNHMHDVEFAPSTVLEPRGGS